MIEGERTNKITGFIVEQKYRITILTIRIKISDNL